MALVPLASKGNYFHIYDFRVQKGRGDEFIRGTTPGQEIDHGDDTQDLLVGGAEQDDRIRAQKVDSDRTSER